MGGENTNPNTPNSTSASNVLSADELSRKRARDRKSQRAMRDRQKYCIEELQQRVGHLSQLLASETAALQQALQCTSEEAESLRAENQKLKYQLEEARFMGVNISFESLGFHADVDGGMLTYVPPASTPGSIVEVLPGNPSSDLLGTAVSASPALNASIGSDYESLIHTNNSGRLHAHTPSVPQWGVVPLNSPASAVNCLSDRILQSYILSRRLKKPEMPFNLNGLYAPEINALFVPQIPGAQRNDNSVSAVVTDILRAFHEVTTLPNKVACFCIMVKFVNWLIYRNQETYEELPTWLRPLPIQFQVSHPAWIDRVPWPRARVYIISHPETVDFNEFSMVYSSSFEVIWPYDASDVVVSTTRTSPSRAVHNSHPSMRYPSPDSSFYDESGAGDGTDIIFSLNPVYAQHLTQLKNWTVGEKFRRKYPELSVLIDQDCMEFWP